MALRYLLPLAAFHFKAAAALYPICWRSSHVPGTDFTDLVDAPVRILVARMCQCVLSPAQPTFSTRSPNRMKLLAHTPIVDMAVSCTCGRIRRPVNRLVMT